MFEAITEHNEQIRARRANPDARMQQTVSGQRPVGASSMQRICETLRSALNAAIREELITVNVATLVELPAADRPKPRVWTRERVAQWQRTGEIPLR
ncbi:MAG: hypothetical protein ACRDQ5_02680 [Sciscionella sp.]